MREKENMIVNRARAIHFENEDYHSAAAKTVEEAKNLVKAACAISYYIR